MSRPTLVFHDVLVRRMPGFADGGFRVDEIGSGINLVHGPNASGKSTLAKSMIALLWPTAAPRHASLVGELEVDGRPWRIELDAGHVRCQRDGHDVAAPVIAPAETRDRYYLSLQHLLALEDGRDLASVILRESSGGYDLARAGEDLGFKENPSSSPKLRAALKQAKERVRRARDGQQALREKEARLDQLEQERDDAVADRERIRILQRAIEHRRAIETRDGAAAQYENFASEIGRLTGHELDDLEKLERRKEEERRRRQVAHSERERARQQRTRCELPAKGVPSALLPTLRAKLRELRAAEQTWRERATEVERLRAEQTAERSRMGDALSDDQLDELARVGPDALTTLSDLAERMERVAATGMGLDELESWIGCSRTPTDLDAKREAMQKLHAWLSAEAYDPSDAERAKRIGAAGAGALVVAGVVGTVVVNPVSLIIVAAGAGLAWYTFTPRPRVDARDEIQETWDRLGVAPPGAWTVEAVAERIVVLQREVASGTLQAERETRWAGLADKRERHAAEVDSVRRERDEIAATFGLAPNVEHPSFLHLVSRILRWQDLSTRCLGAIRARDEAAAQRDAMVVDTARALKPFGYAEVTDSAHAEGAIEDLERRAAAWDKASAEMGAAERAVEEAEQRIGEAEAEIATVYHRYTLKPGDESSLRDRLEQRDAYRTATEALRDAEREVSRLTEGLAEEPELRERTESSLREELERCTEASETIEPITQDIGKIRAKLAEAKERHDLEEALAELERARDSMREAREQAMGAVVGQVLVDAVRNESRDLERPRVFHRARELFTDITDGRYRLDLGVGEPPEFRAVDTTTGVGHALEELSSGTRVQLLLAVRVAFIEEQEPGPALPLFLDETLGNSDDRRAQAIIRAAISVARTGRQIFYFTAQHDEAGKWLGMLEDDDSVALHRIDLLRVRGIAEESDTAIPIQRPPRPSLPTPNGIDRLEFGRKIGVPPFDPRRESTGGIHLWHVIDDIGVLHKLLQLDITKWGQLENLVRHGGRELVPEGDVVLERARAAVSVFEKAAQYWRIGRGKPVDRRVLIESGLVSDAFLDAVCELAESVEGDAARLIRGLERKQVKRFPTKTIEKLARFLREHRYLDDASPLSTDEIRERVLASCSPLVRRNVLTPTRITELVGSVPRDA